MPYCTVSSQKKCNGAPCDFNKIASGEVAFGCCGNDCIDTPIKDLTSCRANQGCFDVGLTGNNACCPAQDGTMLACCNQDVTADCSLGVHAKDAKCRYTSDGQFFVGKCNNGACEPVAGKASG